MTDATDLVGPLPEEVRARVAALAADALGSMAADQLPASLRRVAAFAPQRRARLAGTQINAALETDPDFRERLAVQVRAAVPEVAQAVEAGQIGSTSPVEIAAVAHLLRPEGWEAVLAQAVEAVVAERTSRLSAGADEQVEQLRARLADSADEQRAARERAKAQLDTVKQDNVELRRRLGEARSRLKTAEASLEELDRTRAKSEEQHAAAEAASQSESRRLRAALEAAEAELSRLRRSGRHERDSATLRTRLLLDVLTESVQGLRHELALPNVPGAPADELEAELASEVTSVSSGIGSLTADDPALLEQLLSLPRARLIVDGYNVTKTAWPQSTLQQQRDRLVTGLAPLVVRSRADTLVVFDAAETEQRPPVSPPRGVKVRFSPYGVIADDVIRDLVAVEPEGRVVVVVTDDRDLARDVARSGARVVGAMALARLVGG